MGLDISHSIAIRKRPATTDPDRWGTVTEEDYAGFNVDFNHFSATGFYTEDVPTGPYIPFIRLAPS
jgi:hypothetical protein